MRKDLPQSMPQELYHDTMSPIEYGWHEAFDVSSILGAILASIADLAREPVSPAAMYRIRALASGGSYIATDRGNFFDCQQEAARDWEAANVSQ